MVIAHGLIFLAVGHVLDRDGLDAGGQARYREQRPRSIPHVVGLWVNEVPETLTVRRLGNLPKVAKLPGDRSVSLADMPVLGDVLSPAEKVRPVRSLA